MPTVNLDKLSTAQLIAAARRHMESWQTLTYLLSNDDTLSRERALTIWHTAEDHAELAAEMMNAARLRLAEELTVNA